MLTRVEAGNMSSSSSKFTYVNVGSVSITAPVSTVVSPVSVFVTVKDVSADKERSLMVMFGDSLMLAEDDTGANEMRSCPLVGPGCPDAAPTITTSSC